MKPHYKTVGEIRIDNNLWVGEDASAYDAARVLLDSDFHGMPVLDKNGQLIGKITEMDLLRILKTDRPLRQIRVGEIMEPAPPVVGPETSLEEALEIMEAHRLLRLPVFRGGCFIGNVTRHDLLRAWLGTWLIRNDKGLTQVIA
jgi:CBS domain-containing protein